MPTTRPRHVITETEEVARAINDAASRWPEERNSRAKLLSHLIREGHRALRDEHEQQSSARRDAVAQTSGTFTGVYPVGYLAALREDWPA